MIDTENNCLTIGKGLLEDRTTQFSDFLCFNWGMTFILFSYSIQNNYLSIIEEGFKIIKQDTPE